ncbi:MAG: HAD family hydrolase [Novosphingobium sp.]
MYRVALIYDFDGTLSPGNMQQHTLIPALGFDDGSGFWNEVKKRNRDVDGDEILAYMHYLLEANPGVVSASSLRRHGSELPLFGGVDEWFDRINAFGANRSLDIEHYIISSGLREMIEGSSISENFKHIFASRYAYTGDTPKWPAVAINYTTKTQYLFRINKGIDNNWDDASVNSYIPMQERPLPFERMIFLGDGGTDIPTMKMIKYQGGTAIAVFDEAEFRGPHQKKVYKLIAEDRANYVCPADYNNGSLLDITIKGVLGRIARATGYVPGRKARENPRVFE